MSPSRSIGRSILLFFLLYGALLAPWPGWDATYARYLRGYASLVFSTEKPAGFVRFEPAAAYARNGLDSLIVFGSENQAKMLGFDSRAIGWIPTALASALILATPFGWRRRLGVLLVGLSLVHLYIVFVFGAYFWNQSAGTLPLTILPYSPAWGAGLQETLVTQMGLSIVVPVLIWLFVTRRVVVPPRSAARKVAAK